MEEKAYPSSTPGHSFVKIIQIGVCGTDLNAFKGAQPYFTYPRVLGHELAAEFIEGDAAGFEKGDLITVLPYKSCGKCFACTLGKSNCCSSLSVLGVHEDGGMSEYISVPNHIIVRTKGMSADQIALIEPLAIGAHAVKRISLQPHDTVMVMGAGPIGIGLLHFLLLQKIKTIIADTNSFRLNYCKKYFPSFHSLNPTEVDMLKKLKEITEGNMPSVIFDATGNLDAIHQSLTYLSHAGKYILVGLQQGNIQVSHPEFHKREATLMSSRNATHEDFQFVIDALQKKSIEPETMITHRIDLNDVVNDFPKLFMQKDQLIKAMIKC